MKTFSLHVFVKFYVKHCFKTKLFVVELLELSSSLFLPIKNIVGSHHHFHDFVITKFCGLGNYEEFNHFKGILNKSSTFQEQFVHPLALEHTHNPINH